MLEAQFTLGAPASIVQANRPIGFEGQSNKPVLALLGIDKDTAEY